MLSSVLSIIRSGHLDNNNNKNSVGYFSLIRFSWIFLLLLNSIFFFQNVGLQAEPLYLPSWSASWMKGVLAERNDVEKPEGVEVSGPEFTIHNKGSMMHRNCVQNRQGIILDPECTVQRNSKLSVRAQNKKCTSSFHHTFWQLFMLICLPQSGGNLKDLTSKQRYRVFIGESYMVSGSAPVDPKEATNSKALMNESDDKSIHLMTPKDERIHDVSLLLPSLPQEEVENAGMQKNGIDESEKVIDSGNTKLDSGRMYSNDELGSQASKTERTINKTHVSTLNLSNIQVRREPGDGLYNYASDSKGAKILATNKETKGASNILNKDKDKYLRTPCSAENKYFDLELSEETLIISIAIANHEFYSSTVRQFELWGNLVYPAEAWDFLGMFEAENIRTMQTFELNEPKWVRYLRTRMVNHYGSDFYCTLSVLEVHGVDAIEWLLEDWIAEEASSGSRVLGPQRENTLKPVHLSSKILSGESSVEKDSNLDVHKFHDLAMENDDDVDDLVGVKGRDETYNFKEMNMGDQAKTVYQQTTRPALDSVMKLLMQKVRSLEHNQPLVSRYIQELNNRYKEAFKGFNHDLALMNTKLNSAVGEMANLRSSLDDAESRWMHEKLLIQDDLVNQLKRWDSDMELLRSHLKSTESKRMVALGITLLSAIGVITMQIMTCCLHLVRILFQSKKREKNNPSPWTTLWMVPFFCCVIVIFILSI